ncbi:MORC family CW-type zinc finger protein 3b isoform X2 [Brachyhypopomus gauderio]|uniref:MORC family CW-type zinc finger protein 3b isoform X2 n=1 Tax=Brachyhypopomus gauderio TaxID=698409 RepID=UPI0040434B7A
MATRKHRGIPLSSLNPKFLHTNSTSHTWPFSAIAELIDNAYDPDVRAKQFWVDWTRIKGLDCLSFMDNGEGMTRARLHKMLSFGYSDKKAVRDHVPVGIYGNGFKSGSMRLGKDAIVFTKTKDSMSIGLLSQSYLQAIKAQQIMVPILTFRRDGQNQAEDAASLEAILSHSLFSTEKELFSELRAIGAVGPTGTRVIIWNLRTTVSGETEFDFAADKYDIQIRASAGEKSREDRAMSAESEWSLRAYCSILYLKPRMQINIRGQRVKTQLISKSLAHIANDSYRPSFLTKRIRITFGFNTKSKEHCGIMMYHKNRLIKAYERVSCQRKAERKGIGVIGVIECNFLQPTHNKQDFDDTDQYRKTMYNLSIKLEDFWNEIRYKRKKEDPKCSVPIEDTMKVPDQVWVQCDSCLKWRRLPDGFDCSRLPEKWFCNLNHDPQFRSCLIEEELEDQEEEQKSYPKPFKRRKRRHNKSVQEESVSEGLDAPNLVAPLSARQPSNSVSPQASPSGTSTYSGTGVHILSPTASARSELSPSLAQRSPQPLINLTACSDSLKRTKRKHFSTEVRAAGVTPCTSVPPTALPQGASTFTHTEAMLTANTRETKWEVESDGRENSDEPVSSVPSGMAVRSEPVLEEEEEQGADTWHEMWAPEEVGGSDFKQEDVDGPCEEELEEETWTPKQPQEEELLERMREAMEDRDSCREEVEVLRGNCATLQDERSELLSTLRRVEQEKASLSSLCDQLKRELEKLRGNADKRAGPEGDDGPGAEDRRKLKKLRLRLARLLVCFMPALDLEHVDISSEVIDDLLDQVLEEVT